MSTVPKMIEILGPGCARCQQTYKVVREVVDAAGIDVNVIKVESIDRMVELGLLATPGLVADGRVVLAGRVPSAAEIRKLLGVA